MRNYIILVAALLLSACGEDGVVHGVDSGTCDLVTCEDNAELIAECGLECPDKLCDIVTCEDNPTLIAECGLECVDPCEAVYDCEDPLALECDLACPDPIDPCEGVVCGDAEAVECGLDCPPACDPTEVIGEELIGYRVYSATFSDHGWTIAEPTRVEVRVGDGTWVIATSWDTDTAYWDGGAFVPLEYAETSRVRFVPASGLGSNYYFNLEAEDYSGTCEGHCGYDLAVDIAKEFAPVYKTCE